MTTEVIIAGMSLLGTLAGSFGGIYVFGQPDAVPSASARGKR
ncbi:MAG: hypothetical protein ACLR4Z_11225 [Butyricicoccaceae bacterium]